MQVCISCYIEKEYSEFHRCQDYTSGYNKKCKECVNKASSESLYKKFEINNDYKVPIEKICIKCGELKELSLYYKDNRSLDGVSNVCKVCRNSQRDPLYLKEKARQAYLRNRDKILSKQKERILRNKKPRRPRVYKNKKPKIDKQSIEYKKQRAIWEKNRRKNPYYKLHKSISKAVSRKLKQNNSNKNGKSILQYLPYTMHELKLHIESLWEPWMNWENYGVASLSKKSWQIDHIIPRSLLPYDSMEHPNFLICWELSNLRPLEAIENIKKGNKLIVPEDSIFEL